MLRESKLPMTKRQSQILLMVIQGKTSRQIANELELSIHTVSNHRKRVLAKTGCANITELMRWGMRNNLIQ